MCPKLAEEIDSFCEIAPKSRRSLLAVPAASVDATPGKLSPESPVHGVQPSGRTERECKPNRRNSRHQKIRMNVGWLLRMPFASETVPFNRKRNSGGPWGARQTVWLQGIVSGNLWIPDKSPRTSTMTVSAIRICMPTARRRLCEILAYLGFQQRRLYSEFSGYLRL